MNEGRFNGLLKHWDFILIDLLCLQGSYILAYRIISKSWFPYISSFYLLEAVLLTCCQMAVILFLPRYSGILRRKPFDEFLSVCRMTGDVTVLMLILLFLVHNTHGISRLQTGTTVLIYIALDFILRQLHKRAVKQAHSDDSAKKKLVLVTSSALVPEAKDHLYHSDVWRDFHISQIILFDDWPDDASEYEGIPLTPISDEIIRELSHQWVDEIFILQPDNMVYPASLINGFVDMGIKVSYTLESFTKAKWQNREPRKLGSYNVTSNSIRFITPGEAFIKRITDIVGGVVGCLITAILTLILGPMIKRADPGPIFFGQERIGQNGKHFRLYKFRSMYMDAEKRKADLYAKNKVKDGMMFKLEDDPRIIGSEKKKKNGKPGGLGNFIRNTSLDEFPQFYNVLKGEMSLVGWRPCTLDEWEKYDLKHRVRASMKPGITGMWQVSGRSTITDFEEVVRLDREYIENWSLALDLKILLKTIITVISRKGAA